MNDSVKGGAILRLEVETPNLKHLAKMYRDAMANSDLTIAEGAQAAAMKVANAEGALAEAVSITRFINDAGV